MNDENRRREDEALMWVRRLHDPDFADWDAHVAWLEADLGNARAFDRLLLLVDSETTDLAPPLALRLPLPQEPANDNMDALTNGQRGGRRGWWLGLTAAAASVAAVVGFATLPRSSESTAVSITVRTAPGERRTVLLKDGTQVAMNGDTVLRVEGGPDRRVEVRRGQAFFAVAHDAQRPFRVSAGDVVLQDVGTAFDVTNADGAVDVAVREGAVLYDPDDTAVRLTAGRSIHVAHGAATERAVEPRAVGGWRGGRLVYRDETLDRVASGIARSTGAHITVDRDVADRRFSGVVMIGADRLLMFRRLAAITGTTVERDAGGWRMSSPDR